MEQNAHNNYCCTACGSNAVLLPDASGGREPVCVSCPEPVKLDQGGADNAPEWFEPRLDCTDESRLEWFYESLHPETWFEPGKVVSGREAALLLCAYNPNWDRREDGTSHPLAGVVDASMTREHARLLEFFERLESVHPFSSGLSLAQWRDLAREGHFVYDTRVDDLLPAVQAGKNAAHGNPARPKLQSQQQEEAILHAIVTLKHAPTSLRKPESGKAGVKAAVRAMLPFSVKVFDKAWERLLKDGRIGYAT